MANSPRNILERNANGIAKIIEREIIPIANDMKDCLGDMDYSRIVNTPAVPPLERANTLVQRVITQVEVEPERFRTFTDVLKKHGKLSSVKCLVDPDGLIVADDQNLVPLKKVSVEANMTGYLVGLQSTFEYSNDGEEPLEVLFKFPVEESFAVVGLEAVIGGRKIKAQIREKEEAKHAYDDAKARGFTTALAEEKTGDIFSISLGNLPPKSRAEIHLKLVGELPIDAEGAVRFTLPAVLKQRYTPTGSTDPLIHVSGMPGQVVHGTTPAVYDFSLTVAEAEAISVITSPTHNITTREKSGLVHVSLQNPTPLNKDLVVLVKFRDPHQPKIYAEPGDCRLSWSTYMTSPAVMLNYFPKFETEEIVCEFIFLIDRSGSMRGSIENACKTLTLFLKSLPPGCSFNIIGFGSHFTPLFPNSVPYNQQHLDEAITHVKNIQADFGGTELLLPLEHIFKQPSSPGISRQLFILTDGSVSNTRQCIHEVQKNAKYVRVFTFGIGSGVSTELVKGMARVGNGTAEFIHEGEQMQPKVISSLKRALQPAVTDLSIKFNVPSTFKVYQAPEDLPTLFSGDKVVVYGIMKKRKSALDQSFRASMNGTATLTGQILGKPIEFKITFEIPPTSDFQLVKMPIVHHLASKSLIQELQRGEDWFDAATTRKQKNRIVNLSLESGVVSLHTAYIALDEVQDKVVEGAVKTWDVFATTTMCPAHDPVPFQATTNIPMSTTTLHIPASRRYSGSRSSSIASLRHPTSQRMCSFGAQGIAGSKAKPVIPQFSEPLQEDETTALHVPTSQGKNSKIRRYSIACSNSLQISLRKSSTASPPCPPCRPCRRICSFGAQVIAGSEPLQEDKSTVQKVIVSPKKELELEFLISLQSAEGFWRLVVLRLLNFFPPFISCNIKQICATVCALAYMEIKFPSQRDEWELVAKKAEAWLECQELPDEVNLDELKKEAIDHIINNFV